MSLATAVFFVALLAHSWVGVRDVIMDYVHPVALAFKPAHSAGLQPNGNGIVGGASSMDRHAVSRHLSSNASTDNHAILDFSLQPGTR